MAVGVDSALRPRPLAPNRGGAARATLRFGPSARAIGGAYLGLLSAVACLALASAIAPSLLAAVGARALDLGVVRALSRLHGSAMLFLVAVPAIPCALGRLRLRETLATERVAYPKLDAAALCLFALGAVTLITAVVEGRAPGSFVAVNGIWPDSIGRGGLLAMLLLSASGAAHGLTFLVTAYERRRVGLIPRWAPFAWSLALAGLVQLLAFPPLAGLWLLGVAERALHVPLFDPAEGGDIALYRLLVALYAGPVVAIAIVPALGAVSEVISRRVGPSEHPEREIAAYVALTVLAMVGWRGRFVRPEDGGVVSALFALSTLLALVPLSYVLAEWIARLSRTPRKVDAPLAFGLVAAALLAAGELATVVAALPGLAAYLTGTHFALGALHFRMSSLLVALLSGLFERARSSGAEDERRDRARVAAAWLLWAALNAAFLPQLLQGAAGAPPVFPEVPRTLDVLRVVSLGGAALSGVVLSWIAVMLLRAPSPSREARGES